MIEFPVRASWNHKFVTTQSRGNELLKSLGPFVKENIRIINILNERKVLYRNILTTNHLQTQVCEEVTQTSP